MIAYIDGFNLYFGIRQKSWQRFYWLNVRELCKRLLSSDDALVAVKYFTAHVKSPAHDPHKSRRQVAYLDVLRTLPDLKIIPGHYLHKPTRCRACGATWDKYEEKCTDTNIAVEMLVDAYQDACDGMLLLSADGDLSTGLRAVRKLFPRIRQVVAFPPARQSRLLQKLADAYVHVGRRELKQSQFPDDVLLRSGVTVSRPAKWR